MSGLFGSITIKGNRLTDYAGQTATVGIPIPFGFGKFSVSGNIAWAGKLKEKVKKKKQGKGGVKTEEYTYTLSYAIAFCEGPIYGYLTIKRGGKVVFTTDPNAKVEDKAYAAKWLQKVTLYFGTEEQMPDSTIEAVEGGGKVPAHRGVAYIVVEDDDVTSEAGAVPQYEAVVIASAPDIYVTSHPFPIYAVDALNLQPLGLSGILREVAHSELSVENVALSVTPLSGQCRDKYVKAFDFPNNVALTVEPVGGTLKNAFKTLNSKKDNAVNLLVIPLSGTQKNSLIVAKQPANAITLSISPTSGTLA